MKRTDRVIIPLLFLGLLLSLAGCAAPPSATLRGKAANDCDLPACAHLMVTQDGQLTRSQAAALSPAQKTTLDARWKIDTGTPSPDGAWVAYTSIGNESGGPVFLQNVQSGEWINLIEKANANLPAGQGAFALEYGWDVIGWFPDSSSIMIGPLDLSLVVIVDLPSYTSKSITFPGGGRGGRMFIDLARDGSRFIFIGDDPAGDQLVAAVDIGSGQVSELMHLPYAQGILSNPRYSPDQSNIAYLAQTGQPDPGFDYSLHLLSPQTGQTSLLVQDNLTVTVPVWSPDGSSIAFVRRDAAAKQSASQSLAAEERTNVWVISLKDHKQTQVTFADGFVRSPTWDQDNQTIAFVLGDGQVNLANLGQPGKTWLIAGPTTTPELTNAFFLP